MKAMPREARRITYSSEIRALKLQPFSAEQRLIINGALLGDGCLYTAWGGTSKNYRFAKMHSVKQREYVDWTYKKLHPFVLTPPKLYEPTQALRVRTISHPELTALHKLFYKNGKKVLPENIREIIKSSLALAVWFMDDGNAIIRNGKLVGYNLNTQSFSFQEHKILICVFNEVYDIYPVIERNKKWYRLAVSKKLSRKIFRSIIQEHIIPSMKYKLG